MCHLLHVCELESHTRIWIWTRVTTQHTQHGPKHVHGRCRIMTLCIARAAVDVCVCPVCLFCVSSLLTHLLLSVAYAGLMFSYSELTACIPLSGGAFGFVRATMGVIPALIVGVAGTTHTHTSTSTSTDRLQRWHALCTCSVPSHGAVCGFAFQNRSVTSCSCVSL